MLPDQALELTKTYGVMTVMLFLMSFFLAWLIVYVMRGGEKREERLAKIISENLMAVSNTLADHRSMSREAIARLDEANRKQKEEHYLFQQKLEKIDEENKLLTSNYKLQHEQVSFLFTELIEKVRQIKCEAQNLKGINHV